MGFLVMGEAFDCWAHGKTANDYTRLFNEWHAKDLQALVRRDRNHPVRRSSGASATRSTSSAMSPWPSTSRDIVHAEDPTRPVTAGCNDAEAGATSGAAAAWTSWGSTTTLA